MLKTGFFAALVVVFVLGIGTAAEPQEQGETKSKAQSDADTAPAKSSHSGKEPRAWIVAGEGDVIHFANQGERKWEVHTGWTGRPRRETTKTVCTGRMVKYGEGIITVKVKGKNDFEPIPYANLSALLKSILKTELRAARATAERVKDKAAE
jgi:hypothetical protein